MSAAENFVLRSTPTSPFGRKVRMAIEALGLTGRVDITPADPLDENDTLRQQNPLGKMPCLVLRRRQHDLRQRHHHRVPARRRGTERLLPLRGRDRYRALTLSRLADGIMDASILVVYETRFRPDCRARRAGLRISAARSRADWRRLRHRRPTRAKPTSFRSAYPARSVTSTGASRSTGAPPSSSGRLVEPVFRP